MFPRIPQASPGGGARVEVTGGECEVRSPWGDGVGSEPTLPAGGGPRWAKQMSHGCERSVAESGWDRDGARAVSRCRGQERGRDDRPHSALGQLHIVLDQRTFL